MSAKANLDGRVISLVGPNEAGKTSLLGALAHLSNSQPIIRSELTRGVDTAEDDDVIEASFFLDDDDVKPFDEVLRGQRPRWLDIGKKRSGNFYSGLKPRPTRDLAPRRELAQLLSSPPPPDLLPGADNAESSEEAEARRTWSEASKAVQSDQQNLTEEQLSAIRALGERSKDGSAAYSSHLVSVIDACIKAESSPHPHDVVRLELFQRRPRFAEKQNQAGPERFNGINRGDLGLFGHFDQR